MTVAAHDLAAHRRYLNAYYRRVKGVYDLSRKYYLFGRDRALRQLLAEEWSSLVEIGPGTGRNLAILQQKRPGARYGGVEAADEMLAVARKRCPAATIELGFAEDANLRDLLGAPPERVLFSYCLSMVQNPESALTRARESLAPGGQVVVVDFGDMSAMPAFRGVMKRFLRTFHVHTPDIDLLQRHGAEIAFGPGRYYLIATMGPLTVHAREEAGGGGPQAGATQPRAEAAEGALEESRSR